MAILYTYRQRLGFVLILIVTSILAISCTRSEEPAISLEDVERFATQTREAMPTETDASPTLPPTATLEPPTGTPIPPTEAPPPSPTPILPAATRITFAPGATYGSADGTISVGETKAFVLEAMKDQPILASVGSFNNDVILSIITENGVALLPAEQNFTSWQGSLPATQDYFLYISGAQETENFSLWVTIPSRIKFDAGTTSAEVEGVTVDGYIASYVVGAQGGQTMDILLTANPDVAALTVWGFSDGQPYMRAVMGSTTFNMQLPSTQDYIINVVPQGDHEVDFTLRVEIE